MRKKQSLAAKDLPRIVSDWLDSCKRKGKISRNTIVVGIVVMDHLRRKCPLTKNEVFSKTGGELKGSRSGLGKILLQYGIPDTYLKEATTRQASHDAERLFDAVDYGKSLKSLKREGREKIIMASVAFFRMKRKNGYRDKI